MSIPKSWYTIALLTSFLTAVAVLQWWQMPQFPAELWIILFISAALFLSAGLMKRLHLSFLMLSIIIGLSFAFFRVAETTHSVGSDSVDSYAINRPDGVGDKDLPVMTLHGFIVDEPDRRPMKTKYVVEVDEINGVSALRGKILVTDHAFYPRHEYGDEVTVSGILEHPTQIEDFAYDRYLSRYGIYAVIYRANIETVSRGHGLPFFTFLYHLKERFEWKLNRLYPEPHASFMAGLLTGSRRGIPDHLLNDFQITGLTHIVAISGYNIAIVIAVIAGALFFLPLRFRFIPSLCAILFFTLFVGASPSVVRAAIMGALGIIALHAGREKHSLIAILLAAALMTAWNPKVLWYDAGFQLSFLSVLGLSFFSSLLERPLRIVPTFLGIRESLTMTLAAQVTAVPLIILLFGKFSLIAPLANLLVAPFIPLAMLFGFLGTLIGFFSEPVGLLIAYPGWGALDVVIRITRFLADLPSASLDVSFMSRGWVLLYYAALLIAIILYHSYTKTRGPSFPFGLKRCQSGNGHRSTLVGDRPGNSNPCEMI